MTRLRRQQAERAGRLAETAAAWLLRLKGYRIVATHWRCRVGEIDLIARRRRTLAFIEVKRRGALELAADSIGVRQRQRISRAATQFLASRPDLADFGMRFDAILIVPWRFPSHITDAWRID